MIHLTGEHSTMDQGRTEKRARGQTLLIGMAHPDDEVGAAGAVLAQKARGDRVVLAWLTRGEMTQAFGALPLADVAARRTEQGHRAAEILGAEARFLDMPDTRVQVTPEAAAAVAKLICEVRPTGIVTWGEAWIRGMRHPDHQATGQLFRDAVLLARIAKVVEPFEPHRDDVPIFSLRDVHSRLPAVAVDVSAYRDGVMELASFYYQRVGFGEPEWLENRLRGTGGRWGCAYAEEFDAWETLGGVLVPHLLPAPPLEGQLHPTRQGEVGGG
jgi:N-acetylglucosamine malate deacetylase 1